MNNITIIIFLKSFHSKNVPSAIVDHTIKVTVGQNQVARTIQQLGKEFGFTWYGNWFKGEKELGTEDVYISNFLVNGELTGVIHAIYEPVTV